MMSISIQYLIKFFSLYLNSNGLINYISIFNYICFYLFSYNNKKINFTRKFDSKLKQLKNTIEYLSIIMRKRLPFSNYLNIIFFF